MIYQLSFGHLISTYLGHASLQYTLVIGLYVAFLGVGSLFGPKEDLGIKELWRKFIYLELLLIFSAFLGVVYILIVVWVYDFFGLSLSALSQFLFFVPVMVIGFLSGRELPFLFVIYQATVNKEAEGFVLFLDYLASFVATLIFPFFMLPFFGLISTILFTMFANIVIASFAFSFTEDQKKLKNLIVAVGAFLILAAMNGSTFQTWITEWSF